MIKLGPASGGFLGAGAYDRIWVTAIPSTGVMPASGPATTITCLIRTGRVGLRRVRSASNRRCGSRWTDPECGPHRKVRFYAATKYKKIRAVFAQYAGVLCMTDADREPRQIRDHDTYKEDHWTVVDIGGIDNVFATTTVDRADEQVRIDFDGVGAASRMNEFDIEGKNINSSVWLPLPEAVQLRDQLTEAIEEARNDR